MKPGHGQARLKCAFSFMHRELVGVSAASDMCTRHDMPDLTQMVLGRWLGNIAAIQELFRWGIEMPTEEAIHRVNDIPRGTVG